MLVYNLEKN
ncbi:a959f162-5379-4007-89e2-e08e4c735287 [Thermothielavioides terrestris]|uniref:A959f162-5379-4007-89e2-e08e4c735287 n=1 Tax=Thermothielavioides terrestris TaxID=2587410 RepID=A0A3S5CVK1_9PEZI|nr:a959f162-5379-4007-89e2-e08e4c735287 [Thermothielavioides terrestris]